jgi:hypothetical protein
MINMGGTLNYFGDVDGITPQLPDTHPQRPAPQSIGPSQLIVHITLHTLFSVLLIQLEGWQHWAGTQSSSTVQLCKGAGTVVTTGETTGVVWIVAVGETVTPGGLPAFVHPLTRTMTPAVNRSTNKSRELFRVIDPDIKEEHDNYLVGLPGFQKWL